MCPDLETLQITATHHTCLQRGTHVQTIQGVARFKQNMYSVQHFACVITGTKVHKLQKTQKLEKNCGFVCIIPKHCYEGLQRKLSLRSSFVSHVCNAVTQQVGLCSTHSQISLLQTVNSDAARSHVQAQDTKEKIQFKTSPQKHVSSEGCWKTLWSSHFHLWPEILCGCQENHVHRGTCVAKHESIFSVQQVTTLYNKNILWGDE